MKHMLYQDIRKHVGHVMNFKLEDEETNIETFDQFSKEYSGITMYDGKQIFCFPTIQATFGFVQYLLESGEKEENIELCNITKNGKTVGYVINN